MPADLELRLRDILDRLLPPWLAKRVRERKTVAHRFLWAMIAPLDALLDQVDQGIRAWLPGVGTPTALPMIGRSRGIIRNQGESADAWAARLVDWLSTWEEAGSQELIAVSTHAFLASHPRVRVINRSGLWITVDADGTITRTQAAWDWDSISHPERNDPDAPWWSDMWIVIQPSPYALRSGTCGDLTGDDGYGLGQMVPHADVDALKGLWNQWKGAHSCIRAVIWTTDNTLFDPAEPSTCPNGRWGAWGIYSGDDYVASDRNTTSCAYWEPR